MEATKREKAVLTGETVTRFGRVIGTVTRIEGVNGPEDFVATPALGITPAARFASELPAVKHLVHADCLQIIHETEKL